MEFREYWNIAVKRGWIIILVAVVAAVAALGKLGDRRLNRRLERIVEAVVSEPDKPFPSLLSTDAELEAELAPAEKAAG